jgi:hypothetical protein
LPSFCTVFRVNAWPEKRLVERIYHAPVCAVFPHHAQAVWPGICQPAQVVFVKLDPGKSVAMCQF